MDSVASYWIAGQSCSGPNVVAVRHPYDGRLVGQASLVTEDDRERAVALAHANAREVAAQPAHVRATALDLVSRGITERADELASLITAESGKPIKWARSEVTRAASTFRWAAEEARRWSGTTQRLDTEPSSTGRLALIRRVPRGPVLGIAPFNFPLNLVAHKVAPAIAVGAPIVLKPAPNTPLTALALGEILATTSLPPGAWSIIPATNEDAAALVRDPRLPVVSFTGSGPVGWGIAEAVPRKHVTLELGGNAAAVVCPDWTDLEWAAQRIALYAMYQAGQSCVSVQRVYVHRAVADEFLSRLVAAVEALTTGDPFDEATDVGPLINEAAAARVERWIEEALTMGAKVLAGGSRTGTTTIEPTVLTNVVEDASVVREEAFGPVVTVITVDSVDEAFESVNASEFGLQAGIFTGETAIAFRAAAELEVGAVIIGDVPSYRAEQMPYGGVKQSGTGREGVAAAMTDLTDERVTVLTGITL